MAFPAVSTGVYGYPIAEAAGVAVATIRGWLADHPHTRLETVTLVAHSEHDLRVLEAATHPGVSAHAAPRHPQPSVED